MSATASTKETTAAAGRGRLRLRGIYYGWWVLVGMVVALVLAEGVTFGAFGAYVIPLEEEFGWSRAQVSFGFSVVVGTVGLLAPIIGRLIDVVGPRRLMLIGAPAAAAALALLAFMTELWQWYLYLALNAVALGCIAYIPAQALAVRWFDAHRAVAVSIIGASVWMGQLVMLPIVQLIISSWGWEDGSSIRRCSCWGAIWWRWCWCGIVRRRGRRTGRRRCGRGRRRRRCWRGCARRRRCGRRCSGRLWRG